MTDDQTHAAADGAESADDRFTVLEVFGLKLEVSNQRLADLLTMDAGEVLASDEAGPADVEEVKAVRDAAEQGVPDVMIAPTTPHDEIDTSARQEMRGSASRLGESMGFTTHVDGVWESPTGVVILTRIVDKPASFAGASHFVEEVSERRSALAGEESTALFIVADQQAADVFKVAIRQAKLFNEMRTISLENLEAIAALFMQERIDHSQAVILLAPVADIDVGEILAVIRSASASD